MAGERSDRGLRLLAASSREIVFMRNFCSRRTETLSNDATRTPLTSESDALTLMVG